GGGEADRGHGHPRRARHALRRRHRGRQGCGGGPGRRGLGRNDEHHHHGRVEHHHDHRDVPVRRARERGHAGTHADPLGPWPAYPGPGGLSMDRRALLAVCGALAAMLALPAVASAADGPSLADTASAVDTTWVIVAGVLVMFMQAGFAFLEIGFSRMKNAGAGVAKILMNFSIASIAYWAVGFALAFGGAGKIAGTHGFFLNVGHDAASAAKDIPFLGTYDISPAALLFFQF